MIRRRLFNNSFLTGSLTRNPRHYGLSLSLHSETYSVSVNEDNVDDKDYEYSEYGRCWPPNVKHLGKYTFISNLQGVFYLYTVAKVEKKYEFMVCDKNVSLNLAKCRKLGFQSQRRLLPWWMNENRKD
jgi:hypothetical protein